MKFKLACIGFAFVFLCAMKAGTEPQPILLWPNGAPGSEGKTGDEVFKDQRPGRPCNIARK